MAYPLPNPLSTESHLPAAFAGFVPRTVWFSLGMKAHSTRRLRDLAKRETPQIYITLNVVNMGTDDTLYVCVKLEILQDGLTLPQNNKAGYLMFFYVIICYFQNNYRTIPNHKITTRTDPDISCPYPMI